jgi:uncharacterized membrane protein YcfT
LLATALRVTSSGTIPFRFETGAAMTDAATAAPRIDWVDFAKGICICLVVMMHSTLGVEKVMGTAGYLGDFIAWAKPFRMPDFFLISGLFLARRLDVPWRSYLDTKVVHFAYFYILWMTIQFGLKGPGIVASDGMAAALQQYGMGFIDPFGTLWFIYLLAMFFVVTKLLRNVPHYMVFIMAALLEMLPLHTGWVAVDEFAARYVYFFVGYWLAPHIFKAADSVWKKPALLVLAFLYVWSTAHSYAVIAGVSEMPGVGLVLGFAGCAAVVATAVLLARSGLAGWIRYLGANSIVVYLAFFLFMAATRSVGLKLYPAINVDVLSAVTSAAGVIGPVLLFWAVRKTPLVALFKRPEWAKLKPVEVAAKHGYTDAHVVQSLSQSQTR